MLETSFFPIYTQKEINSQIEQSANQYDNDKFISPCLLEVRSFLKVQKVKIKAVIMSVISKPILNGVGWYFEQLFNNPIKTKAVTRSVTITVYHDSIHSV